MKKEAISRRGPERRENLIVLSFAATVGSENGLVILNTPRRFQQGLQLGSTQAGKTFAVVVSCPDVS
jgi:hypothetical protein